MIQTKRKNLLLDMITIGLYGILLAIAFLAFFAVVWYRATYGNTGFDSVIFTLSGGLNGVQGGLVGSFLLQAGLPALLCTAAAVTAMALCWRKWRPAPAISAVISMVLIVALLISAGTDIGLFQYIYVKRQLTQLYENEYVDPNTVEITFPEEKRNLIYIYLESMETSFLSKEQGGALEDNMIPELYQLAQDNINFSHNEDVGGMVEVPGASWTVGAMVAQSAGVPLITPPNVTDWQNGYGQDGVFLPGLTSINNILKDAGYYQALMVGSDADFGGRKTYFATHDVDRIYDLYTAREDGIVPPNYWEWWGMEDLHLYTYAKQELTKLAQQDQPFAFTMLTVDTHHIGGYTCSKCGSDYEESYDNVYACASRQVREFVQWIQAQSFYENTTIIITGDHFSMDKGYFNRNTEEDYVRHGYNCFINAPVTPVKTENRQFSALDMFPTTLAALGCTIEGDQLGFGVNLFSDKDTKIEEFGYSRFSEELQKRTDYYTENFYTD